MQEDDHWRGGGTTVFPERVDSFWVTQLNCLIVIASPEHFLEALMVHDGYAVAEECAVLSSN